MAETKPTYKGQGPLLGGSNALFWCRKKSAKKDQVSCNFTAFGSEGLSNRAKCPRWRGGWKHWSKSPRAVLWLVVWLSWRWKINENHPVSSPNSANIWCFCWLKKTLFFKMICPIQSLPRFISGYWWFGGAFTDCPVVPCASGPPSWRIHMICHHLWLPAWASYNML